MSLFFLRTTNGKFVARDDGFDYERAEDALVIGVQGALQIAGDEMHRGGATCAVEVVVEDYDGVPVLRSVVAISVSCLMPDPRIITRV